jgi:hypothetical protein
MNVIIIAAVVVKPQPSIVDEIASRVLNLSVEGTNFLMHTLGKWREDQRLLTYTPNNVAKLIRDADKKGLNVKVEIDRGWDYYLFGQVATDMFGQQRYEITGLCDEMYEFINLLELETLAEEIANDKGMQVVLEYAERYNK